MFGLFNNRKKVELWEVDLLRKVFELLPEEYKYISNQIDEGLLKKVIVGSKVVSNYIGFSYDPKISNKYIDEKARSFCLKGIEVYDKIGSRYILLDIYVAFGLIAGYSTSQKRNQLDISKIKIDKYKKTYLGNTEFDSIKHLFNAEELKLIHPSDIYEVQLEGRTYYHLKDLGDGDFIGIDIDKKAYKITHDPYEIIQINRDLKSLLGSVGR